MTQEWFLTRFFLFIIILFFNSLLRQKKILTHLYDTNDVSIFQFSGGCNIHTLQVNVRIRIKEAEEKQKKNLKLIEFSISGCTGPRKANKKLLRQVANIWIFSRSTCSWYVHTLCTYKFFTNICFLLLFLFICEFLIVVAAVLFLKFRTCVHVGIYITKFFSIMGRWTDSRLCLLDFGKFFFCVSL